MARDDFAELREGRKLPDVRHELLTTLKARLQPLGVLDEFKSAGVFVNWWQAIRYDLRTVIFTGWHHSLIPDAYLVAEYFQAEVDAIEALEGRIGEVQGELAERIEAAAETAGFEPDEGEEGEDKLSAAAVKKYLKDSIDDLADARGDSARRERLQYKDLRDGIVAIETRLKEHRDTLRRKQDELEFKLTLKRIGGDEAKDETQALLAQATEAMAGLNPDTKEGKRKLNALQKDQAAQERRLARIDAVLAAIGGPIGEDEAKGLILRKLHDLANKELLRYLNAEKRGLVGVAENLWDKYAVSVRTLETERAATLAELEGFLRRLNYLPDMSSDIG